MKGGVTKRLEETIEALGKGQLKNALFLTDRPELEKYHSWIEEAARGALGDKENAKKYMTEAQDRIQATLTNPLEDTSLEGVEEMLKEEEPMKAKSREEMTDEELYEECEECHIANAVVASTEICDKHPQAACTLITSRLDTEDIEPEEWLKALQEARDKSEGEAKQEFDLILSDLVQYLERRSSPFLKALKEA